MKALDGKTNLETESGPSLFKALIAKLAGYFV